MTGLPKFPQESVDFMRLVLRTREVPTAAGPMVSVSQTLKAMARRQVDRHPELYMWVETDDGAVFMRLSERGRVIADYL